MSRILFLSRWFPYPPNNGSKLRIYSLLRGLAQQHEVTLLSFADQPDTNDSVSELDSICQEVRTVPWKPYNPRGWRARLGFFNPAPRFVVDTFSPEMKECIEQTLSAGPAYDAVIASQIDMAAYRPHFHQLPALFEEAEVGILYEQFARSTSLRGRARHGLTWAKHRRYLAGLLRHFRACTVVSEQEKELLTNAVPGYPAVEVIPNCINLADYEDVQVAAEPNTLIFTGSFTYWVNHEAMIWFVEQVYPRIQKQIPVVRLTITGDHAGKSLPAAENMTLTGFVQDVRPLIAASWVSLAPISAGGGTRLKILEAMALGTPVVATSKGAEGLDAHDNEHLLLADTAEAFAEAVIRLLREPGLHQRLADNAYDFVCRRYNWATVMPRFLNLVERVAGSRTYPALRTS